MSDMYNDDWVTQQPIECPFCCSIPVVFHEEDLIDPDDETEYECLCTNEECSQNRMVVSFGRTHNEAVKHWNERCWGIVKDRMEPMAGN